MNRFAEGFITQMRGLLVDASDDFLEALMRPPEVAIRLNAHKLKAIGGCESWQVDSLREIANQLETDIAQIERVEWCEDGVYLPARPRFTLSPWLHAGAYYVQDPSSMIHQKIVEVLIERGLLARDSRVLDACAAPGGKTTAVMNALSEEALVVANEYDRKRSSALRENLTKWGGRNILVCQGDTNIFKDMFVTEYSGGWFDLALVDAPCSGEGMMRKKEMACEQWSEGLVNQCCGLQREILENIVPAIRPGGILIYSTCTFNTLENEGIVDWLCKTNGLEPLDLGLNAKYGIPSALGGHDLPVMRFMPHLTRGEGQFVAVLRKPESGEPYCLKSENTLSRCGKRSKRGVAGLQDGKKNDTLLTNMDDVEQWVDPKFMVGRKYKLMGDSLEAMTPEMAVLANELRQGGQRVLGTGVEIGYRKGRMLIPSVHAVLSGVYNSDYFASVELPDKEMLKYLRRENPVLPDGVGKGYVVVKYKGLPVGMVKNIGTRCNNLHPQSWRIHI